MVGSSQSRCFFLRHEASQLVLDVEGWQRTAGTRVILYPQKMGQGLHGCENQLFQEDEETGTIRSYFCGLCLDGSGKLHFYLGPLSGFNI